MTTENCSHLADIHQVTAGADGCQDCIALRQSWVHLRLCMTCGRVGCCDDSPNRHASMHSHADGHPIVKSFEPGEDWGWCFVDSVWLEEQWPIQGIQAHTQKADELNYEFYRARS